MNAKTPGPQVRHAVLKSTASNLERIGKTLLTIGAVAIFTAVVTPSALATSIGWGEPEDNVQVLGIQAAAGEVNRINIKRYTAEDGVWVRYEERGRGIPLTVRSGCLMQHPNRQQEASVPAIAFSVRAPAAVYCRVPRSSTLSGDFRNSRYSVSIRTGDRDDGLITELGNQVFLGAFLGNGNDVFEGGSEHSSICVGNPASGSDSLLGSGCSGPPNQGGRNLRSDIAKGGDGADYLFGDPNADSLDGQKGSDIIRGGDGDDNLIGGPGNDRLYGENGEDRLDNPLVALGDFQAQAVIPGTDHLDGGAGQDTVGYRWINTQVRATATGATTARSIDRFESIERLDLSQNNDIFTSPGNRELIVAGHEGDDQITVSGNASPNFNNRVYCGLGHDMTSIDVNRVDVGSESSGTNMEDGSNECESVYRQTS